MVAYLKLLIAKMKRERFGQSAERGRKLLDQLELQLEELETSAAEDEVAAKTAEPDRTTVRGFSRRKPLRAPLPAHLPRERVVVPAPPCCPCCGGKLVKLGEDVTETLEVVPRQWKVIQTVREKFSCRSCEKITQPPAPFHVIPRARAGASLLAMILYAKFGEHQPLNRQSESFAREGVELDVSTLADWVGACTASLAPLIELIHRHVLGAANAFMATTPRCRCWPKKRLSSAGSGPMSGRSAVRRPGPARRGILLFAATAAASTRSDISPAMPGSFRPMLMPGSTSLRRQRKPAPITEAACWSHGRRHFFELADLRKAPLAIAAVRRIERSSPSSAGSTAGQSATVWRRASVKARRWSPSWKHGCAPNAARLSRHAEIAKAIDYMLTRWLAFTRFLDDGRICLTNNAAERALRGIALGRRAWLFAGSDRGGERAAAMYTLIATAKLNDVNPQAWLADVLRRIADHPAARLHELLPWHWKMSSNHAAAA